MDKFMENATGIAMAIVGVAILYTLVNPRNKTADVVGAVSGGFANALTAAMGGGSSYRSPIMG